MRQPTQPPLPPNLKNKIKFLELNTELRDLKSQESFADYERIKWVITETECLALKERIREKFQKILSERNKLI